MKREISNAIINYSESKQNLDYICDYFSNKSKEILRWFNIELREKVTITIWNDLEMYRNYLYEIDSSKYITVDDVPDWICANCENNIGINILTLDEYKKTKNHESAILGDFLQTLIHEFTHYCHHKLNYPNMVWIEEGLAINLSGQIDTKYKVKAVNNPLKTYNDFALGFAYVLEKYDMQYVRKLICDVEFQKSETPRLWEEIRKYYDR